MSNCLSFLYAERQKNCITPAPGRADLVNGQIFGPPGFIMPKCKVFPIEGENYEIESDTDKVDILAL